VWPGDPTCLDRACLAQIEYIASMSEVVVVELRQRSVRGHLVNSSSPGRGRTGLCSSAPDFRQLAAKAHRLQCLVRSRREPGDQVA
jgi:hypothetical protein